MTVTRQWRCGDVKNLERGYLCRAIARKLFVIILISSDSLSSNPFRSYQYSRHNTETILVRVHVKHYETCMNYLRHRLLRLFLGFAVDLFLLIYLAGRGPPAISLSH